MKKTIWLSYDFGVKGDYEGLYAWLDNAHAKECGNSVAVLEYEHEANFVEELQQELAQHVTLAKHDRIYVIWREAQEMRGKFLFGKRKAAPWSGFGFQETQEDAELQYHG